jgi:Domain of unknown function (DUF4384)
MSPHRWNKTCITDSMKHARKLSTSLITLLMLADVACSAYGGAPQPEPYTEPTVDPQPLPPVIATQRVPPPLPPSPNPTPLAGDAGSDGGSSHTDASISETSSPASVAFLNFRVDKPSRKYNIGEAISVSFTPTVIGIVSLTEISSAGEVSSVVPNRYLPALMTTPGTEVVVPPPGSRFALNVSGPNGKCKLHLKLIESGTGRVLGEEQLEYTVGP